MAATAGELDSFDRSTAFRQEAIKSLAACEDREIKTRYDLAVENRFHLIVNQSHTLPRARALAATAGELDSFDRSTNFRQEAVKSLASGEDRVVRTRDDLALENRSFFNRQVCIG